MFYSFNKEPIDLNFFLSEYEPHYFLGSKSKVPKNKTSHFIENRIEQILRIGLCPNDLPFIIAWKIGAINQTQSTNSIVYYNDFDRTLQFQTQYYILDVRLMVEYMQQNFSYLSALAQSDPHRLYEILFEHHADYFAATYILTLVYFFTKGNCPIYDKYADIALLAIKKDIAPHNKINFKPIESSNVSSSWKRYISYCQMILEMFGEDRYQERCIDRSLWVYGHYFDLHKQ